MSQEPKKDRTVELALHQFEAAALNFAYRFINISRVRTEYLSLAQQFSRETRLAYESGKLTAWEAAEAAHQMRNQLLDMGRVKSCDLGRAWAKQIKAKGLSLDVLLEKYAQQKFRTPFKNLNKAQEAEVLLEIVGAAGRPNPKFTLKAARLGAVGRSLFVLSLGISAYNIATAEDKVWQAGREASNLGGGFLGSMGVGAVAGIWAGPVGIGIGVIIGGVLGSITADEAYVVVVGPSNDFVKGFLSPYVSFGSRNEEGIAKALYDQCGINMDQVFAVFAELYNSYTSDSDDVAEIYLNMVKQRGGTVEYALRLHKPLQELLIRILDEGWTSDEETAYIKYLKSF